MELLKVNVFKRGFFRLNFLSEECFNVETGCLEIPKVATKR